MCDKWVPLTKQTGEFHVSKLQLSLSVISEQK